MESSRTSRKLKHQRHTPVRSRSFRHLRRKMFLDRKLLKEDTRRLGVGLITSLAFAAALDHNKFITAGALSAGVALLLVGLMLWLVGHYDN